MDMDQIKNRLEACQKAAKDCTLSYGGKEVIGYVKSLENGILIMQRLGRESDVEIPLDDIDEILHPMMRELSEGVFKIIRGNPSC
jgi:hypothetical protein